MDDFLTEAERLIEKCRGRAKARTWLYHLLFASVSAIFPLLEAVYFSHSLDTGTRQWLSDNLGMVGGSIDVASGTYIAVLIVLHVLFLGIITWSGREDIVDQALSLVKCREDRNRLRDISSKGRHVVKETFFFIQVCGLISTKMMLLFSQLGNMGEAKCQEVLDILLANHRDDLMDVFDYNSPKSHFNLAIYYRIPDTDTLRCVYSLRDDNFKQIKKGICSRQWEIGQGHLGYCYSHNMADRIGDLTRHPEFSRNNQPDDDVYYRSTMSVPLRHAVGFSPESEDEPFSHEQEKYGVMVLTSSVPDQFEEHHLEMLKYLRKKLEEFIYEVVSKEEHNDSCQE